MLEEWLTDSKKVNVDLAEELRVITKENSQLATKNGELRKQAEAMEIQLKEAKEKLLSTEMHSPQKESQHR